jgi:protein subunit release factor A
VPRSAFCRDARVDDLLVNSPYVDRADPDPPRSHGAEARRSQIGSGDRSEKIRAYDFPRYRVTDHRIGLSVHHHDGVLEGNLEEIIEKLNEEVRKEHFAGGV